MSGIDAAESSSNPASRGPSPISAQFIRRKVVKLVNQLGGPHLSQAMLKDK